MGLESTGHHPYIRSIHLVKRQNSSTNINHRGTKKEINIGRQDILGCYHASIQKTNHQEKNIAIYHML